MPHLLPCLTTLNFVLFINERELNNSIVVFRNMQFVAYWASLKVYYCFLHFAMPCIFNPDMHHTWSCIMPCLCDGCLLCCMLLSGLLPSLASVSFRSCEESVRLPPFIFFMDSFFFLTGSQARWPYPRYRFYLCFLVVRSIAMSRHLPLVYHASHIAMSSL